jgi:hypothetical protein
MKKITIYVEEELLRKLAKTSKEGYHLTVENFIVQVLQEEMEDVERYFREEEGVDIFRD